MADRVGPRHRSDSSGTRVLSSRTTKLACAFDFPTHTRMRSEYTYTARPIAPSTLTQILSLPRYPNESLWYSTNIFSIHAASFYSLRLTTLFSPALSSLALAEMRTLLVDVYSRFTTYPDPRMRPEWMDMADLLISSQPRGKTCLLRFEPLSAANA